MVESQQAGWEDMDLFVPHLEASVTIRAINSSDRIAMGVT